MVGSHEPNDDCNRKLCLNDCLNRMMQPAAGCAEITMSKEGIFGGVNLLLSASEK